MGHTMRKLSIVETCSEGITVGRGRNWGKKLMQHMLRNKFWSASKQMSLKLGTFLQQNLARDATQKSFYFLTVLHSGKAPPCLRSVRPTTRRPASADRTACAANFRRDHGRRHVGGRVGNRPPWKKSEWAMPTLQMLIVVWKPSGNSLSIKL